jgi:hypothetical protein
MTNSTKYSYPKIKYRLIIVISIVLYFLAIVGSKYDFPQKIITALWAFPIFFGACIAAYTYSFIELNFFKKDKTPTTKN